MKKKMHLLGTGQIWFGKVDPKVSGYQRVLLASKNGKPKALRIGKLGAYNRVRLWVEVLE